MADKTLIIWSENHIDAMNSADIMEYWDSIWFGESDEAVILYSVENRGLLMITHYGRVYYN
ncbi:MAG: hypothetical protein WBH03_03480 [Cyclobacteriaceae bacterium]